MSKTALLLGLVSTDSKLMWVYLDCSDVLWFVMVKDRSMFVPGETGGGKVIQRFPDKDWPDVPFTPGIELVIMLHKHLFDVNMFCQFFVSFCCYNS